MATIVKDTDTTIELTLNDSSGAPIDIGTLAGLVVRVFQKSIPFDVFSLTPLAGERFINVTDAAGGKFEIYLNANNTHNGYIGKPVYYEIKTQVVNVNFDSGTEEKSTGELELATLVSSNLKEKGFA
jgi:hypothetical protein